MTKLQTATVHDINGKPVALVKDPNAPERGEPLTTEQIRELFQGQGYIFWRGCRGYVVELETQTGRDGVERVVKLEAVFGALRGETAVVSVPPGEATGAA